MSNKVTLGGDRLGAGGKQKVELHNYERSTHDLSYVWRSTNASGTLIPFINEVALPGDTFDIDLDIDIQTLPTIGPLFGSYKVQLDVFQIPIRLYQGKLHMNMLNIGMKMQDIKLPQMRLSAINGQTKDDNSQINPSSIFKYLGISGIGKSSEGGDTGINREFNALSLLGFFDIYKNYYANKMEEYGVIIHNNMREEIGSVDSVTLNNGVDGIEFLNEVQSPALQYALGSNGVVVVYCSENISPDDIWLNIGLSGGVATEKLTAGFNSVEYNEAFGAYVCKEPLERLWSTRRFEGYNWTRQLNNVSVPQLRQFPLENVDKMRQLILADVMNNAPFNVTDVAENEGLFPYDEIFGKGDLGYSCTASQEGLLVKTYQSDLFNNWVKTDWIDGANGINAITAVDTSDGNFTIDTLQLSRKVYDMLNRIAVSGGTYDDWLNAVYTHERTRGIENPMYMGGLIRELAFQEVVSNASSTNGETEQPLGTLAGKGVLTQKRKGGKVYIKVDEPSIIMGIYSLTPRIDYSQGNKWDVNLKTMDDFHKPALDEIGFQDLITDQMSWQDTIIDYRDGKPVFRSAGKQPAWINYMTNVNKCYGNFAIENQEMFMTLNRRYEIKGANYGGIADLTTYIDPSKFNNIFANTRLDAQNFRTQIAVNMTARRKMSAKLMPNL
jgi:hypothetical protein